MTARTLVFVGSLNRAAPYFDDPKGPGVGVLELDPNSGALTLLSETGGTDNPLFVVPTPDGSTVYTTSEVFGWHEGVITAHRVDPDTGRLTYINKQPTQGSITAHASLHPSGRWVFAANYGMGDAGLRAVRGAVALPVDADGGLGPVADGVVHTGRGPHPERQDGPHAHSVVASPDGRHVLVADLGTDTIVIYAFDPTSGALHKVDEARLPPGTGPRHLLFTPSGRHVLLTAELANTVTSFGWQDGRLVPASRAPLLPPSWSGESLGADVAVAPDGRFVYATNRGHDSVTVLSLDAHGLLTPIAHHPVGRTPRSLTVDPSGRFVLVTAQDDHAIQVLRRADTDGRLHGPVAEYAFGSPTCVRCAVYGSEHHPTTALRGDST